MKIKLLREGAKIPTRADNGCAGYDIYVPSDFLVSQGRNLLPLGFSMALDPGHEAQIRPRSGFSLKGIEGHEAFCARNNKYRYDADVLLGTIDESYRGEVGVIIKSNSEKPFIIPKGTRVAQMVISQYATPTFDEADELDQTERKGGFGHTGSI